MKLIKIIPEVIVSKKYIVEMTESQFNGLLDTIGDTSVDKNKEGGMSHQEATDVEEFFFKHRCF